MKEGYYMENSIGWFYFAHLSSNVCADPLVDKRGIHGKDVSSFWSPYANGTTYLRFEEDYWRELSQQLKEAGIMAPDTWNITVRLAPSLTDAIAAANNGKASVAFEDGVITITADVNELEESTSSNPAQGTHKWIGLGIGTGLSSVALAKYNGQPLTAEDGAEAVSVGLDQDGEFVLYVRAEELVETPKIITLDADGYPEVTISILVVAPDAETPDEDAAGE